MSRFPWFPVLLGVVTLAVAGGIILLLASGVLWIRGERVSIDAGDVRLEGVLVVPRWQAGPFPAAVVVHGSGRVRWQDGKGYARRLVPDGVAVLLYDKRGVGGSTGTYSTIGIADSGQELGRLAGDAAAAAEYLAGRPDIDGRRIGLIGGSQAGWVMPLAASRTAAVAYLVAISGPAVTYGQEIHYSQLTGDDPGPYSGLSDDEIRRGLEAFDGPHGYDPLPVLGAMRVPSLWLLGGADRSVPMDLTAENLRRIADLGTVPIEVEWYPAGDHSLRDSVTGRRIDYWPRIREWLHGRGMIGRGGVQTTNGTNARRRAG